MEQRARKHTTNRSLGLLKIAALCLFTASTALLPGAAGAQERMPGVIERPPVEVPSQLKQPAPEPEKKPELEKAEGAGQLMANLKEVKFSGDIILKERRLQKVVAPYLNHPLSREDMARLKYDLTKLYYDKGYVLVKVTTPPQDLSQGVLEVVVYAGRIGDLEIDSKDLNPKVAGAMFSRVKKGDVFNERTVETAVKDVDDLENLKAKLNLRHGKEFGTTDLLLTVEPAKEDIQQFMLDNYGSELTGNTVATLNLRKSNLFGMGESFGLNLRQSTDELTTVLADFNTPIAYSDLIFDVNYLYSRNGIGDRLAALQARGETQRWQASVAGKLINMRQREFSLRAGMEARRHISYIMDRKESRDDITQAFFESSYLVRKPTYVFYNDMRLIKGVDLFASDRMGDPEASRSGGDPRATRFQPTFYANFLIKENNFLQGLFLGQWASTTLLASDLFAVGGYGSVRGFQPAQETGEDGFQFSLEYDRRFVSTEAWDLRGGPFFDSGVVHNRVRGATVDPQLYSVGIGIEAKAGLFKFGESKLRADWAHPIGDYNSKLIDNDTYYLRFTQNF